MPKKNKKKPHYFTRKTTREEYESYANPIQNNIVLDDNHKSEYTLSNGEVIRRILDAFNQWTKYGVSNIGNIYDIDNNMKLLEPYKSFNERHKNISSLDEIDLNSFYYVVNLEILYHSSNHNKIFFCNQIGIHRLVMEAFIERVEGYYIADHINECPHDNRLENLRRTDIYGNNMAFINKRYKEDKFYFYKRQNRSEELVKQIHEVCQLLEENKLYMSQISERTGMKVSQIKGLRNRGSYRDITSQYNIDRYDRFENVKYITNDMLQQIDEYLREGKTVTDIMYDFNIEDPTRRFRDVINDRRKHLIIDGIISDDYNSIYKKDEEEKIRKLIREGNKPAVISELMGHPEDYIYTRHIAYLRRKLVEKEGPIEFNDTKTTKELEDYSNRGRYNIKEIEIVHKICKLLEENKLTQGEIAKKCGVSKNAVRSIKNGQSWISISANYDVDNHEKHESHHEFTTKEMISKVWKLFDQGYGIMDVCRKLGYNNETTHPRSAFYNFVAHQKEVYIKK